MDRFEIPTKGVGKVPSLKFLVAARMRFGRREIGTEERFVQDAYAGAT